MTVKFLGDVEAEREPELRAALTRAAGGGRPRPRVIWAGLDADPALELLQHRVEQEFSPLGFPPEGRPFRPHLTLGRAAREARPRDFAGLADALEGLSYEAAVLVASV